MTTAVDYLIQKDKVFKMIIDTYGLPVIPKRPQGFETLVLLILEQQVSIDSARVTFLKLKSKVITFDPSILLSLLDEDYRALGVSRQKTTYIKALSAAIINTELDIEALATQTPMVVRETLIKIKGIGNWTIDVYLMFCLQTPDIIPLGDIAIVNTIKELLDIHDKEAMALYTQKWAPHRTLASFLLWHYYLEKRGRKTNY
jgi:DNA-3-methyladenine glycosylase II